jgi:hypothetical protein
MGISQTEGHMIAISIPVHENLTVTEDQVRNINRFAPQAITILHLSRQMTDAVQDAASKLNSMERVFVNPNPIYTGQGTVLKCHVSNFLEADKSGLDFSHFCLGASNELFVRKGVEDYVKRNQFGFLRQDLSDPRHQCHWYSDFRKDRRFRSMMRQFGDCRDYKTQVEGCFFPRDAFRKFADDYMKYAWHEICFPVRYAHGSSKSSIAIVDRHWRRKKIRAMIGHIIYTKEEFYPSSYFATMCVTSAPPYCFMNWAANLAVSQEGILSLRNQANQANNGGQLFSVKRVSRSMDDPIRRFINTLE